MFILCSLNWFNPLVYFLNENLNRYNDPFVYQTNCAYLFHPCRGQEFDPILRKPIAQAERVELALQSILYKHTSAEFLVRINKAVILAFVIPVFYALGMMDRTNYYLSEYDMLVLVEQGSITDKLYAFRNNHHHAASPIPSSPQILFASISGL